jgi:hypothetical protein
MARELLGLATGAESEAVKLNAIRDALDRSGLGAKAEVSVELKPWERLMGDIAGIATISRLEHRARRGLPSDDDGPPPARAALADSADAEVIDAELADPPSPSGPENRPSSTGEAMRGPDRADDPDSDMPTRSGPPSRQPGTGLMTLEDAADANRTVRVHRIRRAM